MGFIEVITNLLSALLTLLTEVIGMLWEGIFPPRTKAYNAKLTPAKKLLNKANRGWLIGTRYALPLQKCFEGFLLASQPGAGKTSSFVLGSLLNICGTCSAICLDASLQCFINTAYWFLHNKYRIICVNFSDKSGSVSDGWNPFPKVKNEVAGFFSTLCSLALGTNDKDPFWRLSSASLLTCLGSILFSFEPQYRTIANVNYLLHLLASAKSKYVDIIMSKYADEELWLIYSGFHRNSDNVKASIIATAKAVLDIFNQEGIKKITSYDTFDFGSLRHEKTIIYVQTAPAELGTYQLLLSTFFDQLITSLLQKTPDDNELPVFMCLEEAGIYKIPILPILFTQGRKYRIAAAIICQSQSQLFNRYPKEDAETILASVHTKLYLSNTELATAKEISEASGQFSYKDENDHERIAPLLTPDEIKSIPPGCGLLLQGHHKPVLLKDIVPYYKDKWMREITSHEPPPMERKLPEGAVPLLPIKQIVEPFLKKNSDGKG